MAINTFKGASARLVVVVRLALSGLGVAKRFAVSGGSWAGALAIERPKPVAAEAGEARTGTREACAMAISTPRGGCARPFIVARRELSGLSIAEHLASR